jgi:membrane-associated phospholipid phosphatase
MAFPDLFPLPVEGGPITQALMLIVVPNNTGMDVFPSLHSGITAYICGFFLLGGRRYWKATTVLALLTLSIVVATVYLRFHYGVDLCVGIFLALCVLWFTQKFRKETIKCL